MAVSLEGDPPQFSKYFISSFTVAAPIVTSKQRGEKGKARPYFSGHCLSGTHSFHSIPIGHYLLANPHLAVREVGRWSLEERPKLLRRKLVMVQARAPGVYPKYMSVLTDPEPHTSYASPTGLCFPPAAGVPGIG